MTRRCLLSVLLGFLTTTLCFAAERPAAVPLEGVRTGSGNPARFEQAGEVFRFGTAESLEACVVAAADAFLCRLRRRPTATWCNSASAGWRASAATALYSPSRDEAITFEADGVELRWQGDHYRLAAQGPLTVRVERELHEDQARPDAISARWTRSVFSRAPAGWCSWYVFWQGIREEQVVQNTDWLAANLKKFGCEYVQIDDGWQGVGPGRRREPRLVRHRARTSSPTA